MPIRPFIRLSKDFSNGALHGQANPFLSRRVIQEYDRLNIEDRLRVHGIIDHENYLSTPPQIYVEKNATETDILQVLETRYALIVEGNRQNILKYLNENKISDEDRYAKVKLFGCIQVYIALDLADEMHKDALPAHPSPPRLALGQ